ncbi:thiol:disulfide interchange protein DsbA/DsbL [Thalassotalea sp. M1531]|uniref:Thiol:disulfide interchange protein n=1 Tax=Thalassotalea algicola TaxID=2716224 RepID=A0A7Y0LCE8_9GAMM|nr:thiol:disulfide interchange protein DsbA/DsbL [Thalassotalea algicola]NMP32004.1 thiol:disulfide interchange protein DsbA/DsbL [Thalassotalea algicola]
MYKKLFAVIFLLLPLFPAQAIEFTEGDYYVEIKGNVTAQKEITEFFSFYCPACFKQEPFMNQLKIALPEGATFKKNHVDGMPGRNPEIENLLTKALIAAKHLNVEDKIVPAIFNYIHLNKANFSNEKDIKNLFVINDVDGDKFDKVFSSFSVNMGAKKMQKNTENIRSQGFTSVPTLIINGKYKPVTNKIKTMDEYKNLVLFLLNKTA